jgi:hypothetical protein
MSTMSLVRLRDLDRIGKFVNADLHRRQELVAKDLARVHGRQTTAGPDVGEVHLAIVVEVLAHEQEAIRQIAVRLPHAIANRHLSGPRAG